MPWLKLNLHADRDLVETLTEALADDGALCVSVEDARADGRFEHQLNEFSFWSRNRVSALFASGADAAAIVHRLEQRVGVALTYALETVADQQWETVWRTHARPMCFGGRLWVCPSWCSAPTTSAHVVYLDPGLAFGSGTHVSTALCLDWLGAQTFTQKEVIDYGCGSGILAIAALRLGARRAWGVDIDPRALQVSKENAQRNGVGERYAACFPEQLPGGLRADILLANILAEPLITLAPRLVALVRPGGHLLLAGLLAEQLPTVWPYYSAALHLQTQLRADERGQRWALVVGVKAGDSRA
jgi:ribosomal protein L11 methyltransferase